MGITDLFRKRVSKDDFVTSWLAIHKYISRSLFSQFRTVFRYNNELDELLSFKETEYLVFWLLRRRLNDATLTDMYDKFLENNKLSTDKLLEQLEIRYEIYDEALRKFTENTNENTTSKQGIQIGHILVKSIENLDLIKNGFLSDGQINDLMKTFKVFTILIERIKMIDSLVYSSNRKYRTEPFLKKG